MLMTVQMKNIATRNLKYNKCHKNFGKIVIFSD